jgi:hypothetical protein
MKDHLVKNKENVLEWCDMFTRGLFFLWANAMKTNWSSNRGKNANHYTTDVLVLNKAKILRTLKNNQSINHSRNQTIPGVVEYTTLPRFFVSYKFDLCQEPCLSSGGIWLSNTYHLQVCVILSWLLENVWSTTRCTYQTI